MWGPGGQSLLTQTSLLSRWHVGWIEVTGSEMTQTEELPSERKRGEERTGELGDSWVGAAGRQRGGHLSAQQKTGGPGDLGRCCRQALTVRWWGFCLPCFPECT